MSGTDLAIGAYYGDAIDPVTGDVGTEDDSLSFVLSGLNPFTIVAVSDCSAPFETGTVDGIKSFDLDGEIPPESLVSAPKVGLENVYNANSNLRCSIELSYSLTIPETNEVPEAPGSLYTFKGGTVVFAFDRDAAE
jgi:hypothetical protein